jgi:drug/metabolite transporter (DMT)-like permease
MQLVLSIVFALLLVTGQTCWKTAVDKHAALFHGPVAAANVLAFVLSPLVLLGGCVYVVATGLYFFMLSRYNFSTVQAMAIPLSLLFSIAVAVSLFNERLAAVNYLGVILIAAGIVLVVMRS